MISIIPHFDQLRNIAKNNQNFSVTENILTIKERNRTTKIDLRSISNLRIVKCRLLFINYFLAILALIFYQFLNRLMENNIAFHFVLNLLLLMAILASFNLKKYSYSVLINTFTYSFYTFKIKI
jgi:hypothetical protein